MPYLNLTYATWCYLQISTLIHLVLTGNLRTIRRSGQELRASPAVLQSGSVTSTTAGSSTLSNRIRTMSLPRRTLLGLAFLTLQPFRVVSFPVSLSRTARKQIGTINFRWVITNKMASQWSTCLSLLKMKISTLLILTIFLLWTICSRQVLNTKSHT